jgi:DNA-directed RNA polymerase subunit RPC12/RpoP
VNRMVCEDCGTVYYSAAARTMVERGERCSKCGGRLLLVDGPRRVDDRGKDRERSSGGGSRA